jgi:hypothetical protein
MSEGDPNILSGREIIRRKNKECMSLNCYLKPDTEQGKSVRQCSFAQNEKKKSLQHLVMSAQVLAAYCILIYIVERETELQFIFFRVPNVY